MKKVFLTFVTAYLLAPIASFACDMHHLEFAADDLYHAAEKFHRIVHNYVGYGHLDHDAEEFEEKAEHLYRVARRGGRSCDHFEHDFHELNREFRHLTQVYHRAHRAHSNHRIHHYWLDLKFAFEDVDWVLHGTSHGSGHFKSASNSFSREESVELEREAIRAQLDLLIAQSDEEGDDDPQTDQ